MVDCVSGMPSCQGEEMTACRLSCVALQTKTDELDTILCLTPEGVVALDGEQRIRYVNPAFSRLTGLPPQRLLGLDEAGFWQTLSEVNCAEAPDQTAAHPDRWLLNIQAPVRRILDVQRVLGQAQSTPISAVLSFRDATREIELQQLTNRFLSTAAHELRAPLASVFGFAEALLTQDFDPESQREFIGIIHQESARMTNLLNELLDLARIEARGVQDLALERLSLMHLLRQTLQGFKPPNGRAAPVVNVQGPETCVSVDPAKLQQAILNVLSNAYKYSPQGGEVLVELTIDAQVGAQPMAGIRICDRGIGMTAAQVEHIFDRFYRVHHASQIPGTGLGMSIVKEILELHGGHVQVHSLPGQGTRTELWIPMELAASH